MTDAQVNIPLLRKAVEWAEAEAAKPDLAQRQWRQADYISDPQDTAWAAARESLGEWADVADVRRLADSLQQECGTAFCIAGWVTHELHGDAVFMQDLDCNGIAAEALGIQRWRGVAVDSGHLFDGNNTIEDVRRIAEEIAGERL